MEEKEDPGVHFQVPARPAFPSPQGREMVGRVLLGSEGSSEGRGSRAHPLWTRLGYIEFVSTIGLRCVIVVVLLTWQPYWTVSGRRGREPDIMYSWMDR